MVVVRRSYNLLAELHTAVVEGLRNLAEWDMEIGLEEGTVPVEGDHNLAVEGVHRTQVVHNPVVGEGHRMELGLEEDTVLEEGHHSPAEGTLEEELRMVVGRSLVVVELWIVSISKHA